MLRIYCTDAGGAILTLCVTVTTWLGRALDDLGASSAAASGCIISIASHPQSPGGILAKWATPTFRSPRADVTHLLYRCWRCNPDAVCHCDDLARQGARRLGRFLCGGLGLHHFHRVSSSIAGRHSSKMGHPDIPFAAGRCYASIVP